MSWRQLTAINVAKILTTVLLLVLAATLGVQDMRQLIYLSLHISYCLWWLLEQWLFPERTRQLAGVACLPKSGADLSGGCCTGPRTV
jgi:hypothetical protein